jgi:hypothetical protein
MLRKGPAGAALPVIHDTMLSCYHGVWVSCELAKADELLYQLLEWYEMWHYVQTIQYNPMTTEGGLFAKYIDLFLKLKQQASVWPSWVKTDEDKGYYI